MKILVLGAGGIIGSALVKVLSEAGAQVRALVLSRKPPHEVESYAHWHTKNECGVPELVAQDTWTAVIDLRASQKADIEKVICSRFLSKTTKWINVSTIYVYRNFSQDTQSPSLSQSNFLTEDHSCNPKGFYGVNKYEVEQYLKIKALDGYQVLSLRVPFVIGRHDRSTRVSSYLESIHKELIIKLHCGGQRLIELLPSSVLAKIILEFIKRENWSLLPSVFNIAASNKLLLRQHLEIAAQIIGKRLLIDSYGVGKPSARTGLSFLNDIAIDASLLKKHLGRVLEIDWYSEWQTIISDCMNLSANEVHHV